MLWYPHIILVFYCNYTISLNYSISIQHEVQKFIAVFISNAVIAYFIFIFININLSHYKFSMPIFAIQPYSLSNNVSHNV